MRFVCALLVAAICVGGDLYGQEGESGNYEHLKCYEQLIGTWEYDGPALEEAPGIVAKGDPIRIRFSYRWILDKNAIEMSFQGEVKKEGGFKITGKGLTGWDAAENRIIEGGLDSTGGHSLATVTYDDTTKTWIGMTEGVDGKGEKTSGRGVLTYKDKDTITLKTLDRKGGLSEGDSPEWTLKKVTRANRVRPSRRQR